MVSVEGNKKGGASCSLSIRSPLSRGLAQNRMHSNTCLLPNGSKSERVPRIRLAIVDGERFVREGIACLFSQSLDFEIVSVVSDAATILRNASEMSIDVLLFDLTISKPNPFETLRRLQIVLPNTRFVLFDDSPRPYRLSQMLKSSASAYITKSDSFHDVTETLLAVARGETRITRMAADWLEATRGGWHVRRDCLPSGVMRLTEREREVVRCFAEGHPVKECALLLGISPSTVDNHRARILRKLGLRKTVDLVRLAIHEGMVN